MTALLYNRSYYSISSATVSIEKMVGFAVENGYKVLGICEKNVLYSALPFYNRCISNGIEPVIGMETDILYEEKRYPVLFFARNEKGYDFLSRMSTYLNSQHDFIDLNILSGAGRDVITVIPETNELFVNNDLADMIRNVSEICFSYGSSSNAYYREYNVRLQQFCQKNGFKMIAAPLACFADDDDYMAYQAMRALKNNQNINTCTITKDDSYYLKTVVQMEKQYSEDAIRNTDEIAEKCCFRFSYDRLHYPQYKNDNVTDNKKLLYSLCIAGLKKRLNTEEINAVYLNRIKYELDTIIKMNYQDYFLIVYDLYLYAKKNNIYMGVGRGSVCGCLVAYSLGITHVDPIKYSLLFERFLNPERITLPDIDIDMPDIRRKEFIDYVRNRYGVDNVCNIITFNTYGSRQAVRDSCKFYGLYDSVISVISNTLDSNDSLQKQYRENARFIQAIDSYDRDHRIIRLAMALQGIVRNISTHASGIIISADSLKECIPLVQLNQDTVLCQYTMNYIEKMGFIKFDFLGLRNLTIIEQMVEKINQKEKLNIHNIPLDDSKTFTLLSSGNTNGIFQLENQGMRNLIVQMKPDRFSDIIALIALYRPGPMENIPAYLKARENPETVRYITEDIRPVLKDTYGIIIYQEQIMLISQKIAGFSFGKADLLRRAISKKDISIMEQMQQEFINGALKKGYSRQVADSIYEDIKKFANYGFNKSHSVAYSFIAYQLAWLKANYPLQFFSGYLDSITGDTAKMNGVLVEARNRSIKIMKPDINISGTETIINGNSLILPLTIIKSVGMNTVEEILNERKENGPYDSYEKFIIRMYAIKIKEKSIETLIKAGALDCFKLSRNWMMENLSTKYRFASNFLYEGKYSQLLADQLSEELFDEKIYRDSTSVLMQQEFESYGFYISSHPVEKIRSRYQSSFTTAQKSSYKGYVKTVLQIKSLKEHRIKKSGEMMAFISCSDEFGDIDIVLMPDAYGKYYSMLAKGDIIYVEGNIDDRESVKVRNLTKIS